MRELYRNEYIHHDFNFDFDQEYEIAAVVSGSAVTVNLGSVVLKTAGADHNTSNLDSRVSATHGVTEEDIFYITFISPIDMILTDIKIDAFEPD